MVAAVAASMGCSAPANFKSAGYAPNTGRDDTLRVRLDGQPARAPKAGRLVGAVISGYLSSRGLPPVQGQFTVTATGLIFRSADGSIVQFPLVGSLQKAAGRQWRSSPVALAYIDEAGGRPTYVFRVAAGVFTTQAPGPLLGIAAYPAWLDSLAPIRRVVEQPLVSPGDSNALWTTARGIVAGTYADSLYNLFGRPRASVGLIGERGRRAGRLGEYIRGRDSLAFNPGSMTGMAQLRHTLAHEMGHRWQSRAPAQIAALWSGVATIRDPKRYGYGDVLEQQAEAIAFGLNFLQITASATEPAAASVNLLNHYELMVPGTRMIVRYLALQPTYRRHPLRRLLTTGQP